MHALIQEFSSGGVQVNPTKKAEFLLLFFVVVFFCFFVFFSPQLILLKSNG